MSSFSVDDVIKRRKEERFPSDDREPRKCACGRDIFFSVERGETGDEIYFERYCSSCLFEKIRAAKNKPPMPVPRKRKTKAFCRWCWKQKKLVGAWCRTCRNNYQRRVIKAALAKLDKGETLTWEDEQTLAVAPYWPIWRKEFMRVARVRK